MEFVLHKVKSTSIELQCCMMIDEIDEHARDNQFNIFRLPFSIFR